MDKLKQLETFTAVAARGSLTAAARAEGVAPAIIGRRLDALESRLGVKLMVRTTRRITLTHEGSAFLEDCQRLLAGESYDCAVRVGELPDSSLVSVRLADNRRLCVATPRYLQQHGRPQTPADLARFACLTLSSDASQTRGWAFALPVPASAADGGAAAPGEVAEAGTATEKLESDPNFLNLKMLDSDGFIRV